VTPVFLDLHIHTSEDPEHLNSDYNLDALLANLSSLTDGYPYLISLTDHNTINKDVYLECVRRGLPILVGAELHIEYSHGRAPYHCHIYFDLPSIDSSSLDTINEKLDRLYPQKVIGPGCQVPHLETVVNEFDSFEFLLLPHGGQSHHTFDRSIPKGVIFDTTLERSIYYNQFDGFTARSNVGLENTQRYFARLGIHDFVNLITCSDNYDPFKYPQAKSKDASPFVPTWMMAEPSFQGLRLSLSESSRLVYGKRPNKWSEHIGRVTVKNDMLDIDVSLTAGLNVVIGGSSSGKTLFVDTVYRAISSSLDNSIYADFGIQDIVVSNPSRMTPHYIGQNYIVQLVNETDGSSIDDIDIVRNVFPNDQQVSDELNKKLAALKKDLRSLTEAVQQFEKAWNALDRIPVFPRLLFHGEKAINPFNALQPGAPDKRSLDYPQHKYEDHLDALSEIEQFIKTNVFLEHDPAIFNTIRTQLSLARDGAEFSAGIESIIERCRSEREEELKEANAEQQQKNEQCESLLKNINEFCSALEAFDKVVERLSAYSISVKSKEVHVGGHRLSIENGLKIDQESLRDTLNKYLKTGNKIENIDGLSPTDLLEGKFKKKNPKVVDYNDFARKVYGEFEAANKTIYRIETADGKKFSDLSAGWKTSILLDLIIGYEQDHAPLIIDQPEDNLATSYINAGLIQSIKEVKDQKQVILVSHNATIPMLGDAQTVVFCRNDGQKIVIRSSPLEGSIDNRTVVDLIAQITDGGKPAIKKRVKKYNLKSFRGENEITD